MENWEWADTGPPPNMLPLGLEQGRRGGSDVGRLQKRTTFASGRPNSHEQGINIKQKISQWEGRSQQASSEDAVVKAHPPTISRTFSGEVLGNGFYNEGFRGGGLRKASLSKAKSLGLDFREFQAQPALPAGGRLSAPLQNSLSVCSSQTTGNKPLAASIFAFPKVDAISNNSAGKQIITTNGNQKLDCVLDVKVVPQPLPLSTDDQEDNMPAGNFYTSRGFWRKLEGDRLHWEKGTASSGGAQPPPKPLRTFQYQGHSRANNTMGHGVQWDSGSSYNTHLLNTRSRRVARPPNFPPPPCPDAKTDGLSRHKKNRWDEKRIRNTHFVKMHVEFHCCLN